MDLVRVKDVKADIVAQQGGKIVLKFPSDPGVQTDDKGAGLLGIGNRQFSMGHGFSFHNMEIHFIRFIIE